MDREAIYDAQIRPLMDQIIAICKEHDIPMLASFQYDDRTCGAGDLCTTAVLMGNASATLRAAAGIALPPRPVFMAYR